MLHYSSKTFDLAHLLALLHNEPNGLLAQALVVHGGVVEPALGLLQTPGHSVCWLLHAAALHIVHGARDGTTQLIELLPNAAGKALALWHGDRQS